MEGSGRGPFKLSQYWLNQANRPSAGMLIKLTSDYESDMLPQYNNNNYYYHGGGRGVVFHGCDITMPQE